MPEYRVTLSNIEESRLPVVEQKAKQTFGEECEIEVERVDLPQSRSARLQEIAAQVQDAIQGVRELRDELEAWRDNMPEAVQGGMKASELESTMEGLDEIISGLEGVDFDSVDFPSMF
jgi:hypothetical protein